MTTTTAVRLASGLVLVLLLALAVPSATYVVDPGHRGVKITLGKIAPRFLDEGFGFKLPFVTRVNQTLVRQQTILMEVTCYSSDLQQVTIDLKVYYSVPEGSVVRLYRDYEGGVFESLILPRVAEALKEVTALKTADAIVNNRAEVKEQALASAREKIGEFLRLGDVTLEDIRLTDVLERAIEAKMVQEQEAARALFAQQQAETEAATMVIQAEGEAEAIELRGEALRRNPSVLDLQIVSQWDGVMPLVVGPGIEGAEVIMPLGVIGRTNVIGGEE